MWRTKKDLAEPVFHVIYLGGEMPTSSLVIFSTTTQIMAFTFTLILIIVTIVIRTNMKFISIMLKINFSNNHDYDNNCITNN